MNSSRKRKCILLFEDDEDQDSEDPKTISVKEVAQCFIASLAKVTIKTKDDIPNLEKEFVGAIRNKLFLSSGSSAKPEVSKEMEVRKSDIALSRRYLSQADFEFAEELRSNKNLPLLLTGLRKHRIDKEVDQTLPSMLRSYFVPIEATADGNCLYHSLSIMFAGDESKSQVIKTLVIDEFLRHKEEITEMYQVLNIDASDVERRLFGDNVFANADIILLLSKVLQRKIFSHERMTAVQVYDVHPSKSSLLPPVDIFLQNEHFVPLVRRGPTTDRPKLLERIIYTEVDHTYSVTKQKKPQTFPNVFEEKGNLSTQTQRACVSVALSPRSVISLSSERFYPLDINQPGTMDLVSEDESFWNDVEPRLFSTDKLNLLTIISEKLSAMQNHAEKTELEIIDSLIKFDGSSWSCDLRKVSSTHSNKNFTIVYSAAKKLHMKQYSNNVKAAILMLLLRDCSHLEPVIKYCTFFQHPAEIVNELLETERNSEPVEPPTLPCRNTFSSTFQRQELISGTREATESDDYLEAADSIMTSRIPHIIDAMVLGTSPSVTNSHPTKRSKRIRRNYEKYTPPTSVAVSCARCKLKIHSNHRFMECVECEAKYHIKCSESDFITTWVCGGCQEMKKAKNEADQLRDTKAPTGTTPQEPKSPVSSSAAKDRSNSSPFTLYPTATSSKITDLPDPVILGSSTSVPRLNTATLVVPCTFSNSALATWNHTVQTAPTTTTQSLDSTSQGLTPSTIVSNPPPSTYDVSECSDAISESNSGSDEDEDSVNDDGNANKPEPVLDLKQYADVLGISEKQINYELPHQFEVTVKSDCLVECFNFKTSRFIPGKWGYYISAAIEDKVPCSFNADRGIYYGGRSFCRMNGGCGGDCEVKFEVTVQEKPTHGKDLKAVVIHKSGKFILLQKKPTNRELRGKQRQEAMKRLENIEAIKLYSDALNDFEALKILHKNFPFHSVQCLRKAKSENKLKIRTSMDPLADLRNLAAEYRNKFNKDQPISGFIHKIDEEETDATFYLYNRLSLRLHYELLKSGKVTVFLDATGKMIKKYKNKQVLIFLLVGEAWNGTHYVIAEMITTKLTRYSPQYFLEHLRERLSTCFGPLPRNVLCDVAVCDFSYPMIYGYLKGLCGLELIDFLQVAWDVLSGRKSAFSRTLIFICCAHLLRAFSRNLKRKLGPKTGNLREMALHGMARLVECLTLEEFQNTVHFIARLFNNEKLSVGDAKRVKVMLRHREVHVEEIEADLSETDAEEAIHFMENSTQSIKERSPFFHEFNRIVEEEKAASEKSSTDTKNQFYCPTVIKVLSDTYISMFPFWGRFFIAKTKDPGFIRKSNAAVESQFNVMRNSYKIGNNNSFTEFAEKSVSYFKGKNFLALSDIQKEDLPLIGAEKSKSSGKTNYPDVVREKWEKRKKSGKNRHFSEPKEKKKHSAKPSNKASQRPPLQTVSTTTKSIPDLANPPPMNSFVDLQVIARVGQNHFLQISDFKDLFTGLRYFTDRIIDVYMQFMYERSHVKEKYSILPSHFVSKQRDPLDPTKIFWTSYKNNPELMNALNVQTCAELLHPLQYLEHWVLLKISLSSHTCVVYDSSRPENPLEFCRDLQKNVLPVFECLRSEQNVKWTLEHALVPNQKSGWACGLYVIRNAGSLLLKYGKSSEMTVEEELRGKFAVIANLCETTEIGKGFLNFNSSLDSWEKYFGGNIE